MSNIPLTIQTRNYGNLNTRIVVSLPGQPFYHEASYPYTNSNEYCVLVLHREDLRIMTSFTFSDNSKVPSQLDPYLGNSDYTFVFTTNAVITANIPTGALYDWLISEGAGAGLRKIEQLYGALNCANISNLGYTLVGIFGKEDDGNSIERIVVSGGAGFYTMEYHPITFGGKTIYSPVELS